ncbi:MAG: hypothetical protein AB7R90_03745 [Reyranellaceae bacterium]
MDGAAAARSHLTIAHRFHGPKESGNGGYVAGRLAALVGGSAEITLRAPPPLDRPLDLVRTGDVLELRDGATLLAAARPAAFDLAVPPLPSPAQMARAAAMGGSDVDSDFHQCFVCGRGREAGDGLRVWAGRVDGSEERGVAAVLWTPDPRLAGADGFLPDEFLWGALDCPGATAVLREDDERTVLTGRMTGRVEKRLRAGEPATVLAWPIAAEGRKLTSGTAVIDAAGEVCARALILWIVLKE